jgi:2-methylisocitrate lyase-like PEP mutase family enzyme
MKQNHPDNLRTAVEQRDIVPFIGVYDAFSATIAARHFDGLFLSGFGFAASFYGLPDIGFIAWSDIVQYVQRIRTIVPTHHIVVDIDDGYCDPDTACHVVRQLESIGASAVVMEDQARPRRCGHVNGKRLMPLDDFLKKLERVLATRDDLFVVARTDAIDRDERIRRARAFEAAGADAILVDGLEDLSLLRDLNEMLDQPLMFNQIAGGKSPRCSLSDLKELGVSLVNYSTPCLFAAQQAINDSMRDLIASDGTLPDTALSGVGVADCNGLLNENLESTIMDTSMVRNRMR